MLALFDLPPAETQSTLCIPELRSRFMSGVVPRETPSTAIWQAGFETSDSRPLPFCAALCAVAWGRLSTETTGTPPVPDAAGAACWVGAGVGAAGRGGGALCAVTVAGGRTFAEGEGARSAAA